MLKVIGRRHNDKEKVLVIGLDGVPFRIINNFIKMGVTPFLGTLSRQGLMREMRSAIPPVSSSRLDEPHHRCQSRQARHLWLYGTKA